MLSILGVLALAAGCSTRAGGAMTTAPPVVETIEVHAQDIPIYSEWIGTLDGFVNADIKAEVSGYLLQQAYQEGSFVKKGQLLFQIDPRPFQASLDQAEALLAQARGELARSQAQLTQAEAQVAVSEANERRTELDVNRYTPLAREQAITQQDLDNATQNNLAAKAQVQSAKAQVETARAQIVTSKASVQSAKAAVETAQINLGFSRLTSPIDGIPGIALQQVGALVSPASGAITTVSTIDPIKAYFTVSEQEYLDFSRRFPTAERRQEELAHRELSLILADGTTYSQPGKFYFADRQVDVRTGAIRLAGLFPNPGNNLRPGQYGKVRTATKIQHDAVLVPQRSVVELQGTRQIAVVDSSDKIVIHTISAGERVGNEWIVNEGLKPGERVVVEGLQRVRPGMKVSPKAFSSK